MHLALGDRKGFLIDKARGRALSHVYAYSVSRPRTPRRPESHTWLMTVTIITSRNIQRYVYMCTVNVSLLAVFGVGRSADRFRLMLYLKQRNFITLNTRATDRCIISSA